jgi:hypothetical protein
MSKTQNAFTFAEVLLSLMVLTGSMFVLSNIQSRSIRKVQKSADEITRLSLVKQYSYISYFNPPTYEKPIKATFENPEITL